MSAIDGELGGNGLITPIELTSENLGDALVYSYANYLRAYDERGDAWIEASTNRMIAEMTNDTVGTQANTDLLKFLAAHPEYTVENLRDIPILGDWSDILGYAALEKAYYQLEERRAKTKEPSTVNEVLKWPVTHTVTVEDITDDGGAIRKLKHHGLDHAEVYDRSGKQPRMVQGRITNIELGGHNGGLLRVTNRWRRNFEVRPLVDRGRDYLPAVQINFLD